MRNPTFTAGLVLASLLPAACIDDPPRTVQPAGPRHPPALADLPVDLIVRQRTTTAVPGSGDRLRLTVDDVTRGQVMAALAAADGSSVLAARSFVPGDTAGFTLAGADYGLALVRLENRLFGRDSATFRVTRGASALPEREKIERLIAWIGGLEGATFIRNGEEHAAAEAARHLRRKWDAAGDRITTAREFIEHVATRSSLSGAEYRIRLGDGTVVPAGTWLLQRLAELEGGRAG